MRERSVVEPRAPTGVSKALNAAWIRPFLFLIFIVVAWDLTIRLFRIPPYQIPAPGVAHHVRHDLRLPAVGDVRDSRGDADRGLEDGGKLRLSAAGVLAVGAENRDRAAVRGVVRLWHHPESDLGFPAGIFSGGGFRRAGVQVGRSRHGRPGARDAG